MRIAYIQSIGGASGDMLLGALLDLGLSLETLQSDLNKLDISGYELQVTQDIRCEMRGTKLNVKIQDPTRYTPRFLLDTVINSRLSEGVKTRSGEVLSALWRAECRVHGESEEVLELEELGSVDTLVDVVGVVSGLEQLGVERVYAAPLVLGESTPPRWAGGYSNPAPATLEPSGSGPAASPRSRRVDDAHGGLVDHYLGRVSTARLLGHRCWCGARDQRPGGFSQRYQGLAGRNSGAVSCRTAGGNHSA